MDRSLRRSPVVINARPKWVFDETLADIAVEFIRTFCSLTKGRNTHKPMVLMAHQEEVIRQLYGWIDPETGYRKHTTVYLEWPKKNSKTYLIACIGILQLILDPSENKEIFTASGSLEQSGMAFKEMKKMIAANPDLSGLCEIFASNISIASTNSYVRPLSAKAETKEGLNIHTLLLDEMHVFPSELYSSLSGALAGEDNPLTLLVTTAGISDGESIGYQTHMYAKDIADGVIEDQSWYVNIIGSSEEEANERWEDRDFWLEMNPGLGVSKKWARMEEYYTKAKRSPRSKADFFRYHLNVWIGEVEAFFDMGAVVRCGGSFCLEELSGMDAILGLDLSTSRDLTGATLLFPPQAGLEKYHAWSECWLPENGIIDREKNDHCQYRLYAEQGFLHLTDGDLIDYNAVFARLVEFRDVMKINILSIGFDRALASKLESDLQVEGFATVAIPQGMLSMSPPTKELEDLIVGNSIAFPDNGLLRWCFSNARAKTNDQESVFLVKRRSRNRIDPIVALVMALARHIQIRTEDRPPEKYNYSPGQMLVGSQ